MNINLTTLTTVVISVVLCVPPVFAQEPPKVPTQQRSTQQDRVAERLARELSHELTMIPWYGVFDWIEGKVASNGTVTLTGWVMRPTVKEDADRKVKTIDGVTKLNNNIEVLPLSPSDDRLRRALYLAMFDYDSTLFRYALGANPSIHIIVNNGRVVLKGSVSTPVERESAEARARSVPGTFEVKNELQLDSSAKSDDV